MALKYENNEGCGVLNFTDELSIYSVGLLKQGCIDAFSESQNIKISMSNVEELDGSGLQLILFLKQKAQKEKTKVEFIDHSESVADILALLNLTLDFENQHLIS